MAFGLSAGAVALIGGAGALGAGMLSKPKMPKSQAFGAKQIGDSLNGYMTGMNGAIPDMISGEAQYRPQFAANNLAEMSNYANGTGGNLGIIGQTGQYQQAAQGQLNGLRQQDVYGQTQQAGGVRNLLQSINPEGAQNVQHSQDLANMAYQRAQGLSLEQQRNADQAAMGMSASRGRLNDNSSIANQILNRSNTVNSNMQNAMTLNQNAYNQAQGMYQTPGLNLLGEVPMSYNGGTNYMNGASGMIGKSQPQLYSPSTALQIGGTNTANQNNFALANYQGQMAQSTAMMNMIGNVTGSAVKAIGSGG